MDVVATTCTQLASRMRRGTACHLQLPAVVATENSPSRGARFAALTGDQQRAVIEGDTGIITTLDQDWDVIWRGRWTRFERMPEDLAPVGWKARKVFGEGREHWAEARNTFQRLLSFALLK